MTRPVMFLRTAQTEQRIDDLERQIAWIKKYLKVPDEPTESDEEWKAAAPLPSGAPSMPPTDPRIAKRR